jgi:hypothetical protein
VSPLVHSAVERHDEPDIVSKPTERLRQGAGHVTQPAGVSKRRSFRSRKKNVQPNLFPLIAL